MGNYNWFTDAEIVGLKDPYPAMIDAARGYLGAPIRLTFTTGGQHCAHSAHYIGAAADLGTGHLAAGFERDSYVYKLVAALQKAGFKRIEVCPSHVHADIGDIIQPDGTFPAPVLILGQEA
jgi:hypothetical protein